MLFQQKEAIFKFNKTRTYEEEYFQSSKPSRDIQGGILRKFIIDKYTK